MKYWSDCITLTSGCTKVSPACKNCWAEINHNLRMRHANKKYDHDFSEIRVHPENILIIDRTRKPKTFSVWNDAFHSAVSDDVLDLLFEAINRNPQHTYLICTKKPERMAEYFNRAENYKFLAHTHKIFLGTTVENDKMLWRVEELLKCRPFKLFLSIEPMLERINFTRLHDEHFFTSPRLTDFLNGISICIVGCESGHHARETKIEWIEDLREQCISAGTPMWVKQIKINGKMVYDYQPLSTVTKEDLWK